MGRHKKPIVWIENENNCWICISHYKTKFGYPMLHGISMSRFIYQECFDEIPHGMVIRHKCDNPQCINPEHLEIGTHWDNMQDKMKRGRHNPGHGRPTPGSNIKLPKEEVNYILSSTKTTGALARELNRNYSTIWRVRNPK